MTVSCFYAYHHLLKTHKPANPPTHHSRPPLLSQQLAFLAATRTHTWPPSRDMHTCQHRLRPQTTPQEPGLFSGMMTLDNERAINVHVRAPKFGARQKPTLSCTTSLEHLCTTQVVSTMKMHVFTDTSQVVPGREVLVKVS